MLDSDRLVDLIEPVVERARAELVDLEIAGSRNRPILRVFADTADGITIGACAALSRSIESAIESSGLVPERYVLEVSSPGLERRLSRREHFERYLGREIAVRLHRKIDGRRRFMGALEQVLDQDEGFKIVVANPEGRWTFASDEIARAKLYISW